MGLIFFIMPILKIVFTVLEALLALNLLIFVHELGHFLAARWRGLKIDRFAIWFGKPIWKKTINGVEYALGWIPAGGYVALPQMASMEIIEGKGGKPEEKIIEPWAERVGGDLTETKTRDDALSNVPLVRRSDITSLDTAANISPWDKIIVAFAGPLFSFLLAIAFAFVVWGVGKPEQTPIQDSTTIGWVKIDGPAWKAGLRPGDKILEVDSNVVTQFAPPARDSVTWRIVTSVGTNIPIKYVRDGKEEMAYVVTYHRPTKWYERKALRQFLIAPAYPAAIAEVITNSPAARAGIRPGDEVIKVDDQKIYNGQTIYDIENEFTNSPIRPLRFVVRRGNDQFEQILTAEKPISPTNAEPQLGMLFWTGSTNEGLVYPRPFDQIRESAGQIFATIGAVTRHGSDVGVQQLGGAVMIIRVYKNFFDSDNGWRRVLWFSVLLNVNLAMLNMLPLPVLDGGHILLALIEWVRRKPVSAKLLLFVQNGFAILLISFMLYIAFFDIGDWARSGRDSHQEAVVFAPKN
jgi:regulator of sigma E protease